MKNLFKSVKLENTDDRIFLRTVAKIKNTPGIDFSSLEYKTSLEYKIREQYGIKGSHFIKLPMLPNQNIEGVIKKLNDEIWFIMAGSFSHYHRAKALKGWYERMFPDSVSGNIDTSIVIHDALWFVQFIDLKNEFSYEDLFAELLKRLENKDPSLKGQNSKEQFPEKFLSCSCYQMPDGRIFPSLEAIKKRGDNAHLAQKSTFKKLLGAL